MSEHPTEDLFRWGNWEPVIGVEVHVQLATNSKGQLIAKSSEILQLAMVANKKPMPSFVTAQVYNSH